MAECAAHEAAHESTGDLLSPVRTQLLVGESGAQRLCEVPSVKSEVQGRRQAVSRTQVSGVNLPATCEQAVQGTLPRTAFRLLYGGAYIDISL